MCKNCHHMHTYTKQTPPVMYKDSSNDMQKWYGSTCTCELAAFGIDRCVVFVTHSHDCTDKPTTSSNGRSSGSRNLNERELKKHQRILLMPSYYNCLQAFTLCDGIIRWMRAKWLSPKPPSGKGSFMRNERGGAQRSNSVFTCFDAFFQPSTFMISNDVTGTEEATRLKTICPRSWKEHSTALRALEYVVLRTQRAHTSERDSFFQAEKALCDTLISWNIDFYSTSTNHQTIL